MPINNKHEIKRRFQLNISNKYKSLLTGAALSLLITSCAPTAQQLKDAVAKDPSIVFTAIEKAPDKFIEVVMAAQQNAQKVAAERQQADEKKQREEELKNPLKPEIDEKRVIFGNKAAPITIVEYSDFQCPYCSRGYQTMKQVEKEYGDKVRVIFKHLPLDFHPMAMPAAEYFEAVAIQDHGKAAKFHDYVFENQAKLSEAFLKDAVKKVGADVKKAEADIKAGKVQERIKADQAEAAKYNFSGTPGFIINGVSLRGAYPFASFKEVIDMHLKK